MARETYLQQASRLCEEASRKLRKMGESHYRVTLKVSADGARYLLRETAARPGHETHWLTTSVIGHTDKEAVTYLRGFLASLYIVHEG